MRELTILQTPELVAPGNGGCIHSSDCLQCPLPECIPSYTRQTMPPSAPKAATEPRQASLRKPDTPQRALWRLAQRRRRERLKADKVAGLVSDE